MSLIRQIGGPSGTATIRAGETRMTERDEIAEFARLFTGFLEQMQEPPTPGREVIG